MRSVLVVGALLSIAALAASGCSTEDGQDCEDAKTFGCVASCDDGPAGAVAAVCTGGGFVCPAGMVPIAGCEGAGGSGGGGGGGGPGGSGGGGTGGTTWCPKACRLECQGESTLLDCVPDENGCPVQTPTPCGEGRSCWERPNDTPRAFCADLGCGDGYLQPWEGCDDGAYNGTFASTCFAWCQPMREPVLVAFADPEDASALETRDVPGILDELMLGVRSDVGGTIAKLVLREYTTYMRVLESPEGEPLISSNRNQAVEDDLRPRFEWPLSHVGIHAGQTLWFTSQLLQDEVLLLRGDPAPEADAALFFQDGGIDHLDPDVDWRFELWIHPGPVPCHPGTPGQEPPWTSTQPSCVSGCDDPPALRERAGAACVHSLWTCPAGWVPEAECG